MLSSLSFKARVLLLTVASSVVAVTAVLIIAYAELVSDFEDVLSQRQALEARAAADTVNQRLEYRLTALSTFATFLTRDAQLLPAQELTTALERQTDLRELFPGGLLVFNRNAVAIAENISVPGRLGTGYRDRPHFVEAIETRRAVVSRPIIGRATGLPLLSFLAPIENGDGDLVGLVGGAINLAESGILPRSLKNTRSGILRILDTTYFTEVDSLSPGEPMPALPAPGKDPLVDAALSGITSGVVTGASGDQWIFATQHLERVGWLFVRAVPYREATEPARASFLRFASVSLVVLVLVMIAAQALSASATRPLTTMARQIARMSVSRGHEHRLPYLGAPEIQGLARAFNHLMEQRREADKLKDDFVSTVSHELRTPLTSINGSLKLLASGKLGTLSDKAQKMVDVALRNGQQLNALISDLLDFNKAAAGKLSLQIESINVMQAISSAREGNMTMASSYGVRLSVPDSPPLQVLADPSRLRQILDNFISNAIKFSPPQTSVVISASAGDTPKTVRITVADAGEGVPEYFMSRLFERFAQAETGSTRGTKGTGLGLAITRELAHLMDGQVGYYYDQGAHFWLELPQHTEASGGERDENPKPAP
ncbi:MAG: sensor histidine kinase [Pseudomonadota bacterium]|nr:sensor histidine kinase [Pseudomonadota bacterium]